MNRQLFSLIVLSLFFTSFVQAQNLRPARLHFSVQAPVQLQKNGHTETLSINLATGETSPSDVSFMMGTACYQDGQYNAELSVKGESFPIEGPKKSYCCISGMFLTGANPIIMGTNLISSTKNRSAAYKNAWHLEGEKTKWMSFQANLELLASSSVDAKRHYRQAQGSFDIACYSGKSERNTFDANSVARQFGAAVKVSVIKD
jgi:hypothetical protein